MSHSKRVFCVLTTIFVLTSFLFSVPTYALNSESIGKMSSVLLADTISANAGATGDVQPGTGPSGAGEGNSSGAPAATANDQSTPGSINSDSSNDSSTPPDSTDSDLSNSDSSNSDSSNSDPGDSTDKDPANSDTAGPGAADSDSKPTPSDDTQTVTPDDKTGVDEKPDAAPENDESLWYSKKLPLKKEHQKLLWDYCKKRNLDYIDMLALIYVESNFNEKCSSGIYKGYFQINKYSCANIAKTLKIQNKPLDGSININMGTALLSWIMQDKRVKNLEGKKKRDVALSIFQRGTGGYDKYGLSTKYLKLYYQKRDKVLSYFEKE